MIRTIAIVLALATTAHAAPKESPAVARAKQEVATAKAHLKAAQAAQRAGLKIERAKARIAKDQAALAKLQGKPAPSDIGCGMCPADGPDSCDCTGVTPTEGKCRAIARKGETWEDACERAYGISPDAWDINTGLLRLVRGAK